MLVGGNEGVLEDGDPSPEMRKAFPGRELHEHSVWVKHGGWRDGGECQHRGVCTREWEK